MVKIGRFEWFGGSEVNGDIGRVTDEGAGIEVDGTLKVGGDGVVKNSTYEWFLKD